MMSSFLGLIAGIGVIVYTLIASTDNAFIFLNSLALLIVLGGTLSVSIITYGFKEVFNVFKIFFRVFSSSSFNDKIIAKHITIISKNLYYAPEQISNEAKSKDYHPFISDGLRLIENNLEKEQIEYVMKNMMKERISHFKKQVQILQVIAKYPPAFGMIGTIIGLVSVLENLGKFDEVASLGPNMAVALITTLYGLFIANYVFNPIGDSLAARSNHDMKMRRMIIEGVLLIKEGNDPVFIEEVMNAYLLPGERLQDDSSLPNFKAGVAA